MNSRTLQHQQQQQQQTNYMTALCMQGVISHLLFALLCSSCRPKESCQQVRRHHQQPSLATLWKGTLWLRSLCGQPHTALLTPTELLMKISETAIGSSIIGNLRTAESGGL
jgi:hypothetical protein